MDSNSFQQFDRPGSGDSLVIEDDGNVGYAYYLRDGTIRGRTWLYNRPDAPDEGRTPAHGEPPRNRSEFVLREWNSRIEREGWAVRWVRGDDDWEAGVYLGGRLYAVVAPGQKPGWCVAAKDGPLARELEVAMQHEFGRIRWTAQGWVHLEERFGRLTFRRPDSTDEVRIDDTGDVIYADLARDGRTSGWVWLHNYPGEGPNSHALVIGDFDRNPDEFVRLPPEPPPRPEDWTVSWGTSAGEWVAVVQLRGEYYALLSPGREPGSCVASSGGPYARPWNPYG